MASKDKFSEVQKENIQKEVSKKTARRKRKHRAAVKVREASKA